jgi:hypothetical protein
MLKYTYVGRTGEILNAFINLVSKGTHHLGDLSGGGEILLMLTLKI